MNRSRLRATLTAGSAVVFDARPRALVERGDAHSGEGFFESRVLRNVLVVKRAVAGEGKTRYKLETCLYFPFDPRAVGDGGATIAYGRSNLRSALERNFGVAKLDDKKLSGDIAKLDVLTRTPCFLPFLLLDAFERAELSIDRKFVALSDAAASAARERLKAKLKPIAALGIELAPDMAATGFDGLIQKLWQLDDVQSLLPLYRALKLDADEAGDIMLAWLRIAHLQSEFTAREPRIKAIAEWLAKATSLVEGVSPRELGDYQAARQVVRERLRSVWSDACGVLTCFDGAFRALITPQHDATLLIDFLQNVRSDAVALGECIVRIDQCLSFYDLCIDRAGGARASFDTQRQIMSGLRDILTDAVPAEPLAAAV